MTKALEVRNVSKVWPEITALTNVNFSLENSEIHSIIGPNGAGKSTFFGVISGELEPTEGEVWFGGQMVNKIPAWKRTRMGMSRAFQVPKVFPGLSIEENLLVSLRIEEKWKDRLKAKGFWKPSAASMKKTEEFLKEVGLYEQREKNVKNISHGDKKRLEIAIAIAFEPKLLLLDEPTAGMSPEDTIETVKLIKKIHELYRPTILLTEHNMDLVFSISHRITVLSRGQVIVTGKPEEIQSNELVKELYLGKEDGQDVANT